MLRHTLMMKTTRLISHLVNGVNAHTTYLSLTRGDGGQNPDWSWNWRAYWGNTHPEHCRPERSMVANQMFSRGPMILDTQNAEDHFIWDNEQVKHDVVWAFAKPGQTWSSIVLITAPVALHTATIQHRDHVAHELFEKVADANAYKDQLSHVAPWKASRLYFNVSWFFFGSQEASNKTDKSHSLELWGR